MKRPYHELEAEIEHLRQKLDAMYQAVLDAQRDPTEYRRGYLTGYHAGKRRAECNPNVKRRVRG